MGNAAASAGFRFNKGVPDLSLQLNKAYFSDEKTTASTAELLYKTGDWTKKNGIQGILQHEKAHLMDYAATVKKYGSLEVRRLMKKKWR